MQNDPWKWHFYDISLNIALEFQFDMWTDGYAFIRGRLRRGPPGAALGMAGITGYGELRGRCRNGRFLGAEAPRSDKIKGLRRRG